MTTTDTTTAPAPTALDLPVAVAPIRPQDFTYDYGIKSIRDRWTPGLLDVIGRVLAGTLCLIEIDGLMFTGSIKSAAPDRGTPGRVTIEHASGTRTNYSVVGIGYIVPLVRPVKSDWKWLISDALRNGARLATDRAQSTWEIDGERPYGKTRATPRTAGAWDVQFTPQATADSVRPGWYAMPETIVTVGQDGNVATTFKASAIRPA